LLPDGASIVLNAPTSGAKEIPAISVYSAGKAAVRPFARTWTTDLTNRKIRVNVVSPGATEAPRQGGPAQNEEQKQPMFAQFSSEAPLNRLGQPSEIAKAVVLFVSGDARYSSGVDLFVDGGAAQV